MVGLPVFGTPHGAERKAQKTFFNAMLYALCPVRF